jgi:vacuolar protein sorting-associated protein 45
MFLNFGDLGANIKSYVDQFQVKSKSNENIESIEDMKRFVEEYPVFRELSGNVSKHVTLVGELSRRVGEDNLLEVSELEQSLACNDSHANDLKTLQKLIQSHSVSSENKLRLVALYALRYEKQPSNALPLLLDLLAASTDLSPGRIEIIPQLLRYHHSLIPATGGEGLFDATSIFAGGRFGFRGLRGVDNVYTQHSPTLETTLQNLIKGRLKESAYPFVEGGGITRDKSQDIIVFMIGGATYEEAKLVAQVNASSPGVRVVLGGTFMHNSSTFLEEIDIAVHTWPAPPLATATARLRQEIGR